MTSKFVAYYRVSTQGQSKSGLGLDAQRDAVHQFLSRGDRHLIGEFKDIESGKNDDRPELLKAIAAAKKAKATLVIAKLDRLSRKVSFVSRLMDSGVKFIACDNESANELTIHILAAVAQAERKAIGERTKAALAQAKKRGTKIGNPRIRHARVLAGHAVQSRVHNFVARVKPTIQQIRSTGELTLREVADVLNTRGIQGPHGGEWSAMAVKRMEDRF